MADETLIQSAVKLFPESPHVCRLTPATKHLSVSRYQLDFKKLVDANRHR
jgi:hypothetical protein